MLGADGAPVDATYVCPHHPDVTGPCNCRKPGTELFTTAARDLDIDLASSYLVGDRWRNVEAAVALRAHGILVPRSADPVSETIAPPAAADERTRSDEPVRSHERITSVPTLAGAVQQVLQAGALHLTTPPQRR